MQIHSRPDSHARRGSDHVRMWSDRARNRRSRPRDPARSPSGANRVHTQSVKCTQDQWALSIEATTDPGRARAYLQIGGEVPVVRTVSIENIDGFYGIAGGDVGTAEASTNGSSIYKITGTAVVSDPANPGQTKDMPFSIEAPC